MNQKELREIRKRFKPDAENFSRIFGCYVNGAREIVTEMDLSIGLLEKEETELYMKILKKTLSGNLGRNLIDIEFTTEQVENDDQHKLLQALRLSHLQDESMRHLLYDRIIESADMGEDSYVILLASDAYDIPFKGSDDELWDEGSSEVFDYFICCICPVKDAKAALRYYAEDRSFKGFSTGHVLGNPEIGFMFPAFDDRSTNIYNALYYCRNLTDIHNEVIETLFNVEKLPMSAVAQKNAFGGSLETALGNDCSFEVVKALHGEIRERLQLHKESKEPEVPEIYVEDVDAVLKKSGIGEEKIRAFNEACEKNFGDTGSLNPGNIIESRKFEMKTPEVKITVDPEYAFAIQTRVIDGSRYILIPAGEGVEVNGIAVEVNDDEKV
ncbi:MAG: DUF4317 domain-containing protein [Bacillota bacterium]|nr:DUF4317 domain-containing protein [Bacillota bacterium]